MVLGSVILVLISRTAPDPAPPNAAQPGAGCRSIAQAPRRARRAARDLRCAGPARPISARPAGRAPGRAPALRPPAPRPRRATSSTSGAARTARASRLARERRASSWFPGQHAACPDPERAARRFAQPARPGLRPDLQAILDALDPGRSLGRADHGLALAPRRDPAGQHHGVVVDLD